MIERIKSLLAVKNLSSSQFAQEIGVQRSGISHILSGRNKPSLDFVLKILEHYPDINETWLLKGEGEMFRNRQQAALFMGENDSKKDSEEEDKTKIQVLKEEYPPVYEAKNKDEESLENDETKAPSDLLENQVSSNKESVVSQFLKSEKSGRIVKLLAIYDDNSFEEFHQRK